ncbi:MAG TPA: hypothetical protein VER17_14270 [Tepidisphaeraceae bacterium]|nr:hypothetical protein [Tepidisphaeraceae bacterium]
MSRLACLIALSLVILHPIVSSAAEPSPPPTTAPIDRRALVARHDVVVRKLDPFSPLTVGNGEFAFTADVTGLQTFPAAYEKGIRLGTQAQWAWHTSPATQPVDRSGATKMIDTHGRPVPYTPIQKTPAGEYFRANPHRYDLGQIGLRLTRSDGSAATADDLKNIDQRLDLWSGTITSKFEFDGQPVTVTTVADPDPARAMVAASIRSPLIKAGRLAVELRFAYPNAAWGGSPADYALPDKHRSELSPREGGGGWTVQRTLDNTRYAATVEASAGAKLTQSGPHHFALAAGGDGGGEHLAFVCAFSPDAPRTSLPSVEPTLDAAARHWQQFWTRGAAIDFSGSTDPRAAELERRVVLSQYVMAVNSAGSMPPQETGLTQNSWFGKFHLEMHWAHAAHFALWNRIDLLERSLPWYAKILPSARERAKAQGYTGARWPKMTDPAGDDSPSGIGTFICWQQPHPIYFAELARRQHDDRATLEKYAEVVDATAEFMASFMWWDEQARRYVLGPPVVPVQEVFEATSTFNPSFELAYWAWGIETAQAWRERLGRPRNEKWDHVLKHWPKLPTTADGQLYLSAESHPNQYVTERELTDHPCMLGVYGVIPPSPARVDRETMLRTLRKVQQAWKWDDVWSWDYPFAATTAARLGDPELAVDLLLMKGAMNNVLPNGHFYQRENLPLYLPGNGQLLSAVAMMAGGWDGAPTGATPGFPKNGWTVRAEGFRPMP